MKNKTGLEKFYKEFKGTMDSWLRGRMEDKIAEEKKNQKIFSNEGDLTVAYMSGFADGKKAKPFKKWQSFR